jgi:hypothetical protein
VIDMATLSSNDMINADELPGLEKPHIDGGTFEPRLLKIEDLTNGS